MMITLHADSQTVVVVGSGLAGLTVTLSALEAGHRVVLVTKGALTQSNTAWAQGGIAAAVGAGDSAEAHARDTIRAAAGLADAGSVEVLTEGGPAAISWLGSHGVRFDRDDSGSLVLAREAAHGVDRVVHSGGDATGKGVVAGLTAALATWQGDKSGRLQVLEHTAVTELVMNQGRVIGVDTVTRAGMTNRFNADVVMLATGGAGQLYAHTTNPTVATADGIALAMRAGASVDDMEFVQFHPTSLAAGAGGLISEAVRGAGGVLRDQDGNRFMVDVHPDAELAPRDVVARTIASVMERQNGDPAYLDVTGLTADALGSPAGTSLREALANRFPTIHDECVSAGIEWWHEWVPVTPAAHYLMGGVVTDVNGRTSVPGLWAVGEVARTGVHGANRLASNSLLEAVVFGLRAVDSFVKDSAPHVVAMTPEPELVVESAVNLTKPAPNFTEARFTRVALQRLMWRDAGLVRTREGLHRAATQIDHWLSTATGEVSTISELEDRNLLEVARAVVAAALGRTKSVGAHFLSDESADASSANLPSPEQQVHQ